MTLNSEGLEKAIAAYNTRQDSTQYATTVQDYGMQEKARQHVQMSAAISAYLSALPHVDGLEVVAWDVAPKGLPAEPTKSHSFVAEIEKQGGVISPLVTLSQASSVIAGLKEQRDEAVRLAKGLTKAFVDLTPGGSEYFSYSKALGDYFADVDQCSRVIRDRYESGHQAKIERVDERRRAETADARISSLEQANEALMRERASLIETKREQIERLTKERDEVAERAGKTIAAANDAVHVAEEENKRLREVVSASAAALGNGVFISTKAGIEFMELLPVEIRALLSRIGDHNG